MKKRTLLLKYSLAIALTGVVAVLVLPSKDKQPHGSDAHHSHPDAGASKGSDADIADCGCADEKLNRELQSLKAPASASYARAKSEALSPFAYWLSDWKSGKGDLSEGIFLAKQQEPLMLEMIEQDPDLAYRHAVPDEDWNGLPKELRVHVARRFDGEGTYYAIHTCDSGIHRHITLAEFSSNNAFISQKLASHMSYRGRLIGVALDKRYGLVAMEGGGKIEAPSGFPPIAYAPSSGALKILWLSIKAAGQTAYPDTIANVQSHLNAVTNTYASFGYGRVSFTYTITEVDIASASGASFSTIQTEADAAALAAGEDVADYDFVLYRNTWEGNWAWIGDKYVFLKKRNTMTTVHEMAHCMGLHHSNWWKVNAGQPPWGTGVNQLYAEEWDAMAWSDPRGDFSVPEKMKLGWLDEGLDYIHEVSNGVYRLYDYTDNSRAFSTAGVDGAYYGVSIFKDTAATNGEWGPRRYVLSYRDRTNVGSKNMTRGLYLHWEPWTYNGSSGYNVNGPYGTDIIDVHTAANGVNDALLAIGETYVDNDPGNRDGDIYVTVLSKTDPDGTAQTGDEYLDVKVVVGDQSGNQAPTGSLSCSSTFILPGETVDFSVSASDLDDTVLAYHWDFGLGTTVADYQQMGLDGSPNQQFSYAIEGVYPVSVTISDCRGGTYELTNTITVSYPVVSVSAVDAAASETGPDEGVWTITRVGNTISNLIVSFTLGGSATVTDDYTIDNPSPITIAAGQNSTNITLTPVDDSIYDEGPETAILTISSNPSYNIGTGTGTITIADNDVLAPVVTNRGAAASATTSASLSGELTVGESAMAWICWGVTDEGTDSTGAWDNVESVGSVLKGVLFSKTVNNLATNATYYYRCYVTNSIGTNWSYNADVFSGTPFSSSGGAVAPSIAIYREAAGLDQMTLGGDSMIHDWDTTVREDASVYSLSNGSNILCQSGHYLVIYSSRFDEPQDNQSSAHRLEVNSHLSLDGGEVPIAWSHGYSRLQDGDVELITAGGGILNVANNGDAVTLHSERTDASGAGYEAQREPDASGIQFLRLPDSWDYCRLSKSVDQAGAPSSTTYIDVTYDQQDELDAGAFGHTGGSGEITLKEAGHYLVFANTYFRIAETDSRSGYQQRLTLDGSLIAGTLTTAYLRGNANVNSCCDGITTIGTIIETASANQVLSVEVMKETGLNPDIISGRTAITIAKLPDTGDYVRLDDTGFDAFNPSVGGMGWDTELELDAGGFTHTDSQVGAALNDDYLFLTALYDNDDGGQRIKWWQRWRLNGTDPQKWGQTGRYARNSGTQSSGNWSGIMLGMSPGDYVEVISDQLGGAGLMEAREKGLQGVRLGSIISGSGVIANQAPTDMLNEMATLNASLNAADTNYTVDVYWGTSNGGTNAIAWDNSDTVGSWTGAFTTVNYPAPVTAGATNYYTFRAYNGATNAWADPSWQFVMPSIQVTIIHSIPYYWLTDVLGITSGFEPAATNDPDGDGYTTGQEYWSGTDPNANSSHLRISDVQLTGGNYVLKWAHSNIDSIVPEVVIQSKDSMSSGSWSNAAVRGGTNGINSWGTPDGNPCIFYRLSVTNMP